MEDNVKKHLSDAYCTFRLNGDETGMMEIISDERFDPNFFNEFDEPLIHTLLYMFDNSEQDKEFLLMAVKHLMSHKDFNVNAIDKFGESAIFICARLQGLSDVAKLLLTQENIDLTIKSASGLTLKEIFSKNSDKELLTLLENRENNRVEVQGKPHLRPSISVR